MKEKTRLLKGRVGWVCVLLLWMLASLPVDPALAKNRKKVGPLDPDAPHQSTSGPTRPANVAPIRAEKTVLVPLTDRLMTGVPFYLWRHGCGPTSDGMTVGYYDGHGFPLLIPGNASTQTPAVNQAIASQDSASNPQHYEDYCLPMDTGEPNPLPDKSEPPPGDEHASNCIGDYMHTSWSADDNFYGWSWSNYIGPAFQSYVQQMAPEYVTTYTNYTLSTITWSVLTNEIDNNRPLVLLVDSDGDGYTDHFVTVVGYRESTTPYQYGCHDTWDNSNVRWEDFVLMAPAGDGGAWSVWGGTTFTIKKYLLGLRWNDGSSVEELRKIDLTAGTSTVLGTISGLEWTVESCSAMDRPNHKVYYHGGTMAAPGDYRLFTVNSLTGALISNLLLDTGPFDVFHVTASGSLIGLKWNSGSSLEELRSINTTTGATTQIDTISGLDGLVNNCSTIDTSAGRIYQQGTTAGETGTYRLFVINSSTGALITNVVLDTGPFHVWHLDSAGNLVGLVWNNTGGVEEVRRINKTTGATTLLGSVSGLEWLQISASRLYGDVIYQLGGTIGDPGTYKLFAIDALTGTLLSTTTLSTGPYREFHM
jgi:hypothetical protein